MALKAIDDFLIHKSSQHFVADRSARHKDKVHSVCSLEASKGRVQFGTSATERKMKLSYCDTLKIQDKSVNKNMNKTAVKQDCGLISFKGNPASTKKTGVKILEAIAKNKTVQKMIEIADEKMLVFDAAFALLITGTLRPLVTMFMPTDDKEKNKKAAAHSIASGLGGFVIAQAISIPLSAAMMKLRKNPTKFLTKKACKFYSEKDKPTNLFGSRSLTASSDVFSKMAEISMIPVRSAITVALIPVIDKHIISKIFGPVKDPKQDFISPTLYFKGSELPSDTFKKFREGRV